MVVPDLSVTAGGSSDEAGFDSTLLTTLGDTDDLSGYDKLDFSRPERELRPHYTSSSTLKSVKSTSPGGKDEATSKSNNKWNFNHRHSFMDGGGGQHYQTFGTTGTATAKQNLTSDPSAAGLLFDSQVKARQS